MVDIDDAAAGRTANGGAMPGKPGPLNVRETADWRGRRMLVATSRPVRQSLFANADGDINSDDFADGYTCLTDRVRSLVWCMRILDNEVELDQAGLDKVDYVRDTFLNALEMWMDDLDEIGLLASRKRLSEGA